MSRIVFEKDFSHHPLHYFILLCSQVVGLWGIFWFSHQPTMQFYIFSYMSSVYVIWGIVHHYYHKDLHAKIVLEYALFAILALIIFGSVLFRT